MTTQKFIPYGKPSLDASDIRAVTEALSSEVITRGKLVEAFEMALASYTQSKYAVAFSNGSSALSAAYQVFRGSGQDLLITTPNTFIATAAPAKKLGMPVQFGDIDEYGNVKFTSFSEELKRPRSRGRVYVTPVHFAGVACDMKVLSESISVPDVVIIEDAAHALGSFYPDGLPVGSCAYSNMTVFSFHPVKNITTAEGGMITTNSEEVYHRLRTLRNSGIEREKGLLYTSEPHPEYYYEVHDLSSNLHMTEMQAALGLSQLKKLEQFRQKKKQLVEWYRKKLAKIPGITLPPANADERTLYHLFVIRVRFQELGISRSEFMKALNDLGIGSQLHYVPMYNHPALGARPCDYQTRYPKMEEYFQTALSIPFYTDMEEADVDRVVSALRKIIFLA